MIFDAYQAQRGSVMESAAEVARLGVRVQTSQKQNNDWRIVHGLEAGQVIARVESLPQHLQALARYCFGPFTRDELAADAEVVQIALYQQLLADGVKLPGQRRGRPTAEQLDVLRLFCGAVLHHHAEVTWPYSRPGLPTPRMVKRWVMDQFGLDLDVRFWKRKDRASWGSVWKNSLNILDSWEAEVLVSVSDMVSCVA
ncbi:hypothetical protein [Bisbaumannia pacifica]|nr:hypothetical protein [Halomonas pacifica]